jgi:hypothetical protein
MSNPKLSHAAQKAISLPPLLALLALSGCFAGAPVQAPSSEEESLPELQPTDEVLTIFRGERDSRNQFSSTVYVSLTSAEECSGVLIHPRLVLTAGHCLCRGRKNKGTTTIDRSTCEKTAIVKTGERPEVFKTYRGEVKPHRDFKVVLKKKKLQIPPEAKVDHFIVENGKRYVVVDAIAESRADLAVILLNAPVERRFSPAPIGRTEVQLNDRIVAAGYGADDVQDGLVVYTGAALLRRFGRNTVTRVEGETFTIESPGALALPGDSGGPCFREEAASPVLVGISSRSSPGRKATFTSTYRYLEWLTAEIQRAETVTSSSP